MKFFFAFGCIVLFIPGAFSQKKPLDVNSFDSWTHVFGAAISPDGNYCYYYIVDDRPGSNKNVVQSIDGNWKKEFQNASSFQFANDSRSIFKKGKDSLGILTPGKDNVKFFPGIASFKMADNGRETWLACKLTVQKNKMILFNLSDEVQDSFCFINDYSFDGNARFLLTGRDLQSGDSTLAALQLTGLTDRKTKIIWHGQNQAEKAMNCVFDSKSEQLAFIVVNNRSENELWYYKSGMDAAELLADNKTQDIKEGLTLANQFPQFSKDGEKIFIGLQPVEKMPTPDTKMVKLDVYSYADSVLQPQQISDKRYGQVYTSVISLNTKKIIQLEQENERIQSRGDDYVTIIHTLGGTGEYEAYWNSKAQISFYLVSLKEGSRKLLRDHVAKYGEAVELSPGDKWAIYYNYQLKNYFSIEIATGITCNITKECNTVWTSQEAETPELSTADGGSKIWLANDEAILISDNYDIWQIDPAGKRKPIDLTNSYGAKNRIKFKLLLNQSNYENIPVNDKVDLILRAFNKTDKSSGFYKIKHGSQADPKLLFTGPYIYDRWNTKDAYDWTAPIKAKNAEVYIVQRTGAREGPNYFATNDFKRFIAITNVEPLKSFNWLTTELVNWKTFDGSMSAGVLYKPEDFDSSKKYPLIFFYYEKLSDELNSFPFYQLYEGGPLNIGWFVSNGYLVFTPDIHYKTGEPGQSAYNAVVSAAAYLSRMPWVDAKKMGLQGHSFGAYETNYIITRTNIFAAACSASGVCDLLSCYVSGSRAGYEIYYDEKIQGRIGATPWQRPDLYIKNSPIYRADKITTPLLMMNNKEDGAVPFSQGVEFYTSLRRLGKKVWMLQYDNEGHSVERGPAIDFNIRMMQFFDHYLKGAHAPVWMTRGIPAGMKGIDDGLELDAKNKTPGAGLLIKQ